MATEKKTVLTKPTDRELVFTRVFDAPRELVFEAWTEPKHLEAWWGPNGFRTESLSMDLRPGGMWRLIMHGPDGREYRNKTVYSEIVAPERLVYQHGSEDGSVRIETTTTFEPISEESTRVTMRMLFRSAEELEDLVKTYGADKGGVETLERLGDHISTIPSIHRELVLTRIFDAKREDVFRAWTDASILKVWWGPKGFTNPVCEVDAQVGGRLRIVMRGPDGKEYPMRGIFREVIAPERLVFSNVPVDADDRAMLLGVTTVTFETVSGGTKVTVKMVAIGVHPMAARMIEGMEMGWNMTLDRLGDLVASTFTSSERKRA
jgi:uncharacterized protein YndB with AHSA1/START domain